MNNKCLISNKYVENLRAFVFVYFVISNLFNII